MAERSPSTSGDEDDPSSQLLRTSEPERIEGEHFPQLIAEALATEGETPETQQQGYTIETSATGVKTRSTSVGDPPIPPLSFKKTTRGASSDAPGSRKNKGDKRNPARMAATVDQIRTLTKFVNIPLDTVEGVELARWQRLLQVQGDTFDEGSADEDAANLRDLIGKETLDGRAINNEGGDTTLWMILDRPTRFEPSELKITPGDDLDEIFIRAPRRFEMFSQEILRAIKKEVDDAQDLGLR